MRKVKLTKCGVHPAKHNPECPLCYSSNTFKEVKKIYAELYGRGTKGDDDKGGGVFLPQNQGRSHRQD